MWWNGTGGIGAVTSSFELQFSDMKAVPFIPTEVALEEVTVNGNNTVTVEMSGQPMFGKRALILSAYNGTELLKVKFITLANAEANSVDVSGLFVTVGFDSLSGVTNAKAMLWNGVSSLKPLCPSKSSLD